MLIIIEIIISMVPKLLNEKKKTGRRIINFTISQIINVLYNK